MREGERASEESETALCPSVRLQCSNDDARSASEARLGPGVILGLKFRERSGAKIRLRGGAPHGRPTANRRRGKSRSSNSVDRKGRKETVAAREGTAREGGGLPLSWMETPPVAKRTLVGA